MYYTDFTIEITTTEMTEKAMKNSTPKVYARLLLEGAEIIRQLRKELDKARAKETKWSGPEDPPEIGERVLICREKEPGELLVEQAWLTQGGWWKVFGTNCKRILAWRPMPEPPEVNKI